MTDKPSDPEQSLPPEDIAGLYGLARTPGSNYWDFSASRKEVLGHFRYRTVREPLEPGSSVEPTFISQHRSHPSREDERGEAPHLTPPEPSQGPSEASEPQTPSQPMRQTAPQPMDGVATRWYALRSIFAPPEELSTPGLEDRPPMVAVFSLAGGVGKTCLVATLGRALAALGEHVLLADTAAYGPLPLYFGSREFKPGVVRTFSPPGGENDAPVQVLTLEPERYPGDGADEHDPLLGELGRDGRSASRILVDIGTASRQVTRRLLLLRPTILIPILPDISSVATVQSLEAFLFNPANQPNRERQTGAVFYLLNQFDASSPLHLDVRETLQQRLGDRLLPLVLGRSSAVSEALAEGTTVIDYAPGSAVAEDYMQLAGWLQSFVAPAVVGHAGVRWSER
jgi:cellulose synthase operon protein YhjQ